MNLYLSDLSDNACTVAWRIADAHFGFILWAFDGPSPWNDRTRAATFCVPLHTTAGQRYGEELLAALTALDTKDLPLTWTGSSTEGWALSTARNGTDWRLGTHCRLFYAGAASEGAEASHRIWSVPNIDTDDRAASLHAALLHVGKDYTVPAC